MSSRESKKSNQISPKMFEQLVQKLKLKHNSVYSDTDSCYFTFSNDEELEDLKSAIQTTKNEFKKCKTMEYEYETFSGRHQNCSKEINE
jgi:hypothetical protein